MRNCPFCHIVVPAGDPERVQVGLDMYHGKCHKDLRKQQKETHKCHIARRYEMAYQLELNLATQAVQ